MLLKRLFIISLIFTLSSKGQELRRIDLTLNDTFKQQPSSGWVSFAETEFKESIQLFAPDSLLVEILKSDSSVDEFRIRIDANDNKTLSDDKTEFVRVDSTIIVAVERHRYFEPSRVLKYQLSCSRRVDKEGVSRVYFDWRSHYRAEGKIFLSDKEYRIAVWDSDGNGVFNKRDFKGMTNVQFDTNQDGTFWGSNEYFWGDQILSLGECNFLLKELAKDGSYIVFEKTDLILPKLKAKVPVFKVPTVEGKLLSNTNLLGKNYLLVFWASWCAPCVKSFPELIMFANRYSGDVRFISINVDSIERIEKAKTIIEEYKIDWPQVMTGKGREDELWRVFRSGLSGIPLYALVDSDGILRYYGNGGKNLNDLEQEALAIQGTD